MRLPISFEVRFSGLTPNNYSVMSPATDTYNCIAWACGIDNRLLWPNNEDYDWPDDLPQEESIEAFTALFVSIGYEVCDNPDHEEGFEKVAIYADGDEPTHAARQLPSGRWTSKMGYAGADIEHDSIEAVAGTRYGQARVFLRRQHG